MLPTVLSIIGAVFGATALTFSLIALLRQRVKIYVDLVVGYRSGAKDPLLMCDVIIMSSSTLPISIRSIALSDGVVTPVHCLLDKKLIGEFSTYDGVNVIAREQFFTSVPPIMLTPQGAFRGTFAFPFSAETSPAPIDNPSARSKHWYFSICTNRRTVNAKVRPPKTKTFFTYRIPDPAIR